MRMKKVVGLISTILLAVSLASCGQQSISEPSLSSESYTNEQLSEKRQQIIEEGYEIDGYRFRLMQGQYEDDLIIKDMSLVVDNNFSMSKHLINTNDKISLIPSGVNYDPALEELQLNYFIVNNSIEEIFSITVLGVTDFKKQIVIHDFDIILPEEIFTVLKPKEFVVLSFGIPMQLNEFSSMQQNKSDDFQMNITELEINGEKMDNNQ